MLTKDLVVGVRIVSSTFGVNGVGSSELVEVVHKGVIFTMLANFARKVVNSSRDRNRLLLKTSFKTYPTDPIFHSQAWRVKHPKKIVKWVES